MKKFKVSFNLFQSECLSDSEEISNSSSYASPSEYDSSFEDEINVEKGGFYGCEPEYTEKELIDLLSNILLFWGNYETWCIFKSIILFDLTK